MNVPRAWRRPGLIVFVTLAACGDLAHTNPIDPATPVDIRLVGPDSAFSIQESLDFSFVSTPAWTGDVEWTSSNREALLPLGAGHFQVIAFYETSVVVSLHLGQHRAVRTITLKHRARRFKLNGCRLVNDVCTMSLGDAFGMGVEPRDANGYVVRASMTVHFESSRPDILRVGSAPDVAGGFGGVSTPLLVAVARGAAYLVMTTGPTRDSALVIVQ